MTSEQIIEKAKDTFEGILQRYAKPMNDIALGTYPTTFDWYNEKIWKGMMTRERFDEIITYENILKAITLKTNVEKIGYANYERYHWILETTPTYCLRYDSWKKEIEVDGYLGCILKNDGDVDAAFKDMMGNAEMFIDYANDIAATAW